VIQYHAEIKVDHFYSVHSWIGLATLALLVLQWFAGVLVFAFPKADAPSRRAMMPCHKWIGISAFAALFTSMLIGLHNKQSLIPASDPYDPSRRLPNMLGLMLLLLMPVVFYWLSSASAVTVKHALEYNSDSERGAGAVDDDPES